MRWHVRLFLQLLTGTSQVAGRQNNIFSVLRLCTSLCDLPSLISLTIFSPLQKQYGRAFKKLSKFCQRFAFKNFPSICFQKDFKHLSAICFQQFSSDLLSKFCQLFSFQKAFKNFPAISFQKFSSDLLSKVWTLRDGEHLKAYCF